MRKGCNTLQTERPCWRLYLPREIPVIHESPDSGASESLLRPGGRCTAVPETARKRCRGRSQNAEEARRRRAGKRYPLNSAYPIFSRNFTKTLNPPRGVAGRGASRKTTFFFPKIEVISRGTVLFLLSFRQTMQI